MIAEAPWERRPSWFLSGHDLIAIRVDGAVQQVLVPSVMAATFAVALAVLMATVVNVSAMLWLLQVSERSSA